MALFIVRHQHKPEHCPAQDPAQGAMLLNYLSRPNVRQHGIEIQGEAVVNGEHALYLIVDAETEERVRGEGEWQESRLVSERKRHSWQWWELITRVEQPGPLTLHARATDFAGRTQPEQAEWNRLGYGNNSIQPVPVRVYRQ